MALDTPIVQVELAMEGKIDFLRKTNPWGSSETQTLAEQAEEQAEKEPDPDSLVNFFNMLRAHAKPLPKPNGKDH